MVTTSVPGVSDREIEAFCRKWKIARLWLFGSGARGELRPDSDLDFMVEFQRNSGLSLWDFAVMREELEDMIGRPVDLVTRGSIRNPYRKASIERDLRVVYEA